MTISCSVCDGLHVSAKRVVTGTVGVIIFILFLGEVELALLSPCQQEGMEGLYSYAMRSISNENQPLKRGQPGLRWFWFFISFFFFFSFL